MLPYPEIRIRNTKKLNINPVRDKSNHNFTKL